MRADQDTITMLELHVFLNQLSVDLDRIFFYILLVRYHRCLALITVKVETALSVGDTDTLDCNLWLKLRRFLSNEVVTFGERELDHARHRWILVNVPKLWGGLE